MLILIHLKRNHDHPEANMSDFLNFDFNEEIWKTYCSSLPNDRAIEIEGSIGERQPSVDVKRPCIQDSDVVIQPTDFSWSAKEELGHIDSNSSDPETSKNGDLYLDHNRGVPCCGSAVWPVEMKCLQILLKKMTEIQTCHLL
ncbi:hypothetical protein Ddye_004653 [Dipteronia dyeriana]|uniref:Pre-mRNA polyadenylation factor Fip1 domain-containing protein n=1 Tax=Dipteronia dyeriana TaxID=168575 RepID=A0AAD9XUL6_9ROSI|nr:hypothetical protein Ddye_004653 [Dipteronia dyeriana]